MNSRKYQSLLIAAFFAALTAVLPAQAERRVALVVGNGAYAHATRLNNPVNDARDMRERLERLGFDVTQALDANSDAFDKAVQTFTTKLQGAALALFYYAGHGLQFEGVNYLMPVDTRIEGAYTLRRKAVLAQDIIDQMERGARVSLVFLDACRNNSLLRDLEQSLPQQTRAAEPPQRGLARMDPRGSNTLIAFATRPGDVAADGTERNSPFTTALLRRIETPGVVIQEMLTDVTADVMKSTDGRQKPEVLSRLATKIVLREALLVAPPVVAPPAPPPAANASKEREASVAWELAKASCSRGELDAFLKRYADTYPGDLAKARLAAIEAGTTCAAAKPAVVVPSPVPPPSPAASLTADEAFVRSLQTELKRVGCLEGDADGKWGGKTRAAFASFLTHSKSGGDADAPDAGALGYVLGRTHRVCPLLCASGEVVLGEMCVSRQVPQPEAKSPPQAAVPAPPKKQAGPVKPDRSSTSTSGLPNCFAFGFSRVGQDCQHPNGKICKLTLGNMDPEKREVRYCQ